MLLSAIEGELSDCALDEPLQDFYNGNRVNVAMSDEAPQLRSP
jgi:hypothetical protein